ncbi:hypothetical protein GOP47_0026179 [Adiantum capillus-veneris]|uniref:Vacuolar import/degradation Vid27 C-terminal domain-containing protein n=1 Tax=Adiantum capillus-veneris TaxID=13818 RepID=A0A9D4Z3I2_ADICA|nr:hypothetical protein GOP47_0025896 [Adiantum capillus-veneris]KAI5059860.1 hypothetical protein GOP47_0026179 [Adiantum capillus-veneris]
MGASQSREGSLSDSDDGSSSDGSPARQLNQMHDSHSPFHTPIAGKTPPLDLKMSSLSLNMVTPPAPLDGPQTAKLYRHIGGNTAQAQWVVADKLIVWNFARDGDKDEDSDDGEDTSSNAEGFRSWYLHVGNHVKARVDARLQMRLCDAQLRADFVHLGVWALKFASVEIYKDFVAELQNCSFENTYLLEATEENKIKVFGKDFLGWAKPQEADDSIWTEAEDAPQTSLFSNKDLKEAFNEASSGGIQSLVMGALDHSFLVSDTGIEAVKNMASGIHGKGVSMQFGKSLSNLASLSTPKKAMLLRGETNMMLLSPATDKLHSSGVHQLDIPTGKIVAEWKFEKDGTAISMRDVTHDSKGAQLDASGSTFLGLDDNRLCRWDMRDRHGIVQNLESPILNWADGHQFSRGTNFQCFASTGDGCIVVGSNDGKVRLYGATSMRMAKTAFPGLGSPITHIDVTFDGKWILATSDTYLVLISTMFKDKDGKLKTGFSGRGSNKFALPRLLKLTPVDANLAGKDYKLQKGQFSWVTESGKQERHLVATAGKFSVIWNFGRVKESGDGHDCYKNAEGLKSCYCYKVVPREDSVVDSKFMHDKFTANAEFPDEAPLVVATPKNVSSFRVWRD